MINQLKTLKQRIDKNIIELQKTHPYSKEISETISMLIKRDASDAMVQLWIKGVLDLITNIEDILICLEEDEKNFKNKAKLLKEKIDDNIIYLEEKYPLAKTISESIEILLNINAPEDMIRPWLNSIDDIILDIEKELELIGKDSL